MVGEGSFEHLHQYTTGYNNIGMQESCVAMDFRLARGNVAIQPSTGWSRWTEFLNTGAFQTVKKHFDGGDSGVGGADLECFWHQALGTACTLWHFNEEEEDILGSNRIGVDKDEESLRRQMWSTIVFLLKGVFGVRHGLHPRHVTSEKDEASFILHAATYSLAFCHDNDSSGMPLGQYGNPGALSIFQQILETYQHQLVQAGPILDRLPIHIAAANMSFSRTSRSKESLGCAYEIMEAVLTQSPMSSLCTKDSTGMYPLHLAAACGCPWRVGLRSILLAAPEVLDDPSVPPPFLVAAEKANLDSLFELIKLSPHALTENRLPTLMQK